MYREFYSLNEWPFSVTSDPDFLFMSKVHEEALNNLLYGIHEKRGFLAIIGDAGTGKTTLCKTLVNKLSEEEVDIAYLFNPCVSETHLLQTVANDFGIKRNTRNRYELLNTLYEFLLNNARNNKNSVLILDEAQNLKLNVLEQVRLLSNLETPKEKLLQIVLVGQPPLETKLDKPQLEQFRQRISVLYYMSSLSRDEVGRYIYHRLHKAGSDHTVQFSEEAINAIFTYSKGVPRLINILCDRCLLAGFVSASRFIEENIVQCSIQELSGRYSNEYNKRGIKENIGR